jgi:hypothetical protein
VTGSVGRAPQLPAFNLTRHPVELVLVQLPPPSTLPGWAHDDCEAPFWSVARTADEISVMTQSTFDTDWILIPNGQADAAAESWSRAGHLVTAAEEEE